MSPAKKTPAPAKKTPAVPATQISTAEAKQNRQYLMIMIAVSAVIVLVGGYISWKLFGTYIRRTNEVKAQDQYISALKQKKQDLNDLQPNYQRITQKGANGFSTADEIYRALPKHIEYKTLIGVIENISAASGVNASISPSASGGAAATGTSNSSTPSSGPTDLSDDDFTGSSPQEFAFTVTVTGPYDQVIKFLQNTENSLRPINFQSMSLTGTTGTIQASVVFKTYYQGLADIANKEEPLK